MGPAGRRGFGFLFLLRKKSLLQLRPRPERLEWKGERKGADKRAGQAWTLRELHICWASRKAQALSSKQTCGLRVCCAHCLSVARGRFQGRMGMGDHDAMAEQFLRDMHGRPGPSHAMGPVC